MKKVKMVVRILLGIMVLIFGLNKFLQFIPMPPMPQEAGEFMGALVKSGYLMVVVAIVEIITGILLLLNKYVSLALVILFPVLLNAFLFHLFLDLPGIGGAAFAFAMNIYLFFTHKASYRELLNS
mgnify:CR=1 FL=1|jgi:putative oxidoreductase